MDFAPRVSSTHCIVIALTSLMHDGKFILAHREAVHGVDKCAVDWQRPLAATGDEQPKRLFQSPRRYGEKLRPHRATRDNRLLSPIACRNFIAGRNSCRDRKSTRLNSSH